MKIIKWVSDCCLTPVEQFFSCVMARTSYISMRWWCLLCTRPTGLVGLLIVLAHLNNSPGVDMVFYSNTLSWFWTNQSFPSLLKLSAACQAKSCKYQFYCLWFGMTWPGVRLETMIYRTWDEDRNHCKNLTYPVYDYKLIPPLQPWRLQVPRKDKSASL
jgi:hypothetical protein